MTGKILKAYEAYEKKGSGWVFHAVTKLDITLAKLRPLRGGSYLPLPDCIKKKEAIINMKNFKDDECFKWAITRA